MKTFVFKIKIPDYDFTVHEDQILKDFLLEPGTFIEFIKKGISQLYESENDIVHIHLNGLIKQFSKPLFKKVLDLADNETIEKEDIIELIKKLIKDL